MGQNSVQVQVQPEGKKEGIPEEATPRGALKNGREFDWRSRGRAVQAERTADQRLPTEGSAWPPAAPRLSPPQAAVCARLAETAHTWQASRAPPPPAGAHTGPHGL